MCEAVRHRADYSTQPEPRSYTMARPSTYLNFNGNTEQAFKFYRTDFSTPCLPVVLRTCQCRTCSGVPTSVA